MRHKQRKLLEQNITSLKNYIQQNKLDITPDYMIYCITEADPDQQQFKNSKWLIKNLLENQFLWEDIESGNESKAFDTLSRFLNIRKQWPESDFRDINHYKGLSEIAEKIRPFEITKGANEIKREEKAKIYEDTIVLYDKNDYLIVIPKTEEASCFWGRNTEWCTASTQSKNYFNHYNKKGPLLICITPDNKKYQFHIDSPPMDENDKEVENITDPMLIQLSVLTGKLNSISKNLITKELCKIAVQQNGNTLYYIPEELITKELCELAVQNNGKSLLYVPDKFKTKELCEIAIQKNGLALYNVPKELIIPELCEIAVRQNSGALYSVPKQLITLDLYKIAVQQDGHLLFDISEEFKTPELYELAVKQNGLVLEYVPDEFKTEELCEIAVRKNGMAIRFIKFDTIKIKELYELAVKQNGCALLYIPNEFKTPELCKLAVTQEGNALGYVPRQLRTKELSELVQKQEENNKIPQEINDPKWLENKEYEILQHHLDNFMSPDKKLSVNLNYS